MFEMILMMIAVAAQNAGGANVSTGTAMAAAQAPDAVVTPAPAPEPQAQLPIFLAPEKPAAPVFLAPVAPALVAEPQVATGKFTTALEIKPIMNATRGNWIAVREYDGQDLVYVTHLWAWRCGMVEMRVGLNGAVPEIWPLPECHTQYATPNAVLDEDGLPYKAFGLGTVATIEVQVTYDDLTTDTAKFDRQGVLIP